MVRDLSNKVVAYILSEDAVSKYEKGDSAGLKTTIKLYKKRVYFKTLKVNETTTILNLGQAGLRQLEFRHLTRVTEHGKHANEEIH